MLALHLTILQQNLAQWSNIMANFKRGEYMIKMFLVRSRTGSSEGKVRVLPIAHRLMKPVGQLGPECSKFFLRAACVIITE